MRHIVVLGAGFAGFYATQALEHATLSRRKISLSLISDQTHFLFTPLLPNVANAELSLKSITLPLRDHLDATTALTVDRVQELDLTQRVLRTDSRTLPFDYLLLAPGAQVDWHGNEQWRPHAMPCKESRDAVYIREHIERSIAQAAALPKEQREGLLTFAFAGAGPTGVELACELHAGLSRDVFPRAPVELVAQTRFILLEPGDTILPHLPEALRQIVLRRLQQKGIELRLGTRIVERDAHELRLDDGTTLRCDNLFWCAGVTPSPLLADHPELTHDAQGRVLTDDTLQAIGHEGVFVAGDCAAPPVTTWQTAQNARQQGPLAAHNIVAALSGRTPKPFSPTHLGDLITLGRGDAAIQLMGRALEGLPAYALYRATYAGMMPGGMKKMQIMAEWLEHDLTVAQQRALPHHPEALQEGFDGDDASG